MKNIVILGSKGMLGQMVKTYFTAKGFSADCFDERFAYNSDRAGYSSYLRGLREPTIVFNCIGKIKQKTDDANDLLQANTILPAELRNCLAPGVILIHPSTDCVFKGDAGRPYPVDQEADAGDEYGWSKRLGEVVLAGRPNTLVPRVSIIGPDCNPAGKGLMSWVKSNPPGTTIKGFTNHLWNGITTLEWCRQIEQFLLQNNQFGYKLVQFGTGEFHSKYEMLVMFNEVFDLGLRIEATETAIPVDRRLVPDIVCKPLLSQLTELKAL